MVLVSDVGKALAETFPLVGLKGKYLPIKLAPALGCIVDSSLRYITESGRMVFE